MYLSTRLPYAKEKRKEGKTYLMCYLLYVVTSVWCMPIANRLGGIWFRYEIVSNKGRKNV